MSQIFKKAVVTEMLPPTCRIWISKDDRDETMREILNAFSCWNGPDAEDNENNMISWEIPMDKDWCVKMMTLMGYTVA